MSADFTNLIRIPGVQARVTVGADYDWETLGHLLADGFDAEQADLLSALSEGLHAKGADGLNQLQYIADIISGDLAVDGWGNESIRWFLRELLIRLEASDE